MFLFSSNKDFLGQHQRVLSSHHPRVHSLTAGDQQYPVCNAEVELFHKDDNWISILRAGPGKGFTVVPSVLCLMLSTMSILLPRSNKRHWLTLGPRAEPAFRHIKLYSTLTRVCGDVAETVWLSGGVSILHLSIFRHFKQPQVGEHRLPSVCNSYNDYVVQILFMRWPLITYQHIFFRVYV